MEKHQIDIDGIRIEVIKKLIKNMVIRVYPPDGRVRVSAPMPLSLQQIRHQLESKMEWLRSQRARLQAQPPISYSTMQSGELHYFLGSAYVLNVVDSVHRTEVSLKNNVLELRVKPNTTLLAKQASLKRWYQEQMQILIPSLIEKWQPVMGVVVNGWGIKTMKTRWGSCNTRTRRIWLNLVLIKKPITCLEYVIVHEMIHLLEASHNARFYQLMDHFLPEWRAYQTLMSQSVRT
jgi:predicted metal-dependent hydrolase